MNTAAFVVAPTLWMFGLPGLPGKATGDTKPALNFSLAANQSPVKSSATYALRNCEIAPLHASQMLGRDHKYPLPATLLARLAISEAHHGYGYGGRFLINAIFRAEEASKLSGSAALIVDAIDENAKKFYIHFGFRTFENDSKRLFLSMKEITNSHIRSRNA